MKAAALAAVLVLAGCLAQTVDRDGAGAACTARYGPHDVPDAAPTEGGAGPRRIDVLVEHAHQPLLAWWAGANGTAESVRLRSADGARTLAVHAPADRAVHLLSGLAPSDDGPAHWALAATVPAGADTASLTLANPLEGEVSGTWDAPVSVGPAETRWQPAPLVGLDGLDGIESLGLDLAWENGAAGGADFGVAVASGAESFHYRNAAYQASPGAQRESRTLAGDELRMLGWGEGTPALAGPSMSTGGFATTGIAWTLAWSATLAPPGADAGDACAVLGVVRDADVTSR